MIKNIKIGVLSLMLITLLVGGASATSIITEGAITTSDKTPDVTFTATGNNSSYLCNLFIGNASGFETAAGYVTALNNTETSITCNRTLAKGTYTYYVTMYNSTEIPVTTTSSSASLKVSVFGSVIEMLTGVVDVFTPIVTIVIKIIPILVALAIATFVIGLMTALLGKVKGKM